MPTRPLADSVLIEAVALRNEHKTLQDAAKAAGVSWHSFNNRLTRAAERGLDGSVPARVPIGRKIKGVSTLYGPEGDVKAQWVKEGADQIETADLIDVVREAFIGYEAAGPIQPPEQTDDELLTVYVITDAHIGLRAEADECGEEDNLELGVERLRSCMRKLVAKSPPSSTALVLNLGDFFHTNDHKPMTPAHGNILDVGARYTRMAKAGVGVFRECVDLALTKHDKVIVKHLQGNHDLTAWVVLQVASAAHYAENPRVTVDEGEADYYFLRFGSNLIGAHHGHRMKHEELAMLMANECREDWGETLYHWFLHGHFHHAQVRDVMGVRVEGFRTLTPPDGFHAGKYGSPRSMVSITLHRDEGEEGRDLVNIRPICRKAADVKRVDSSNRKVSMV
jgi:hypothetical protein